MKINKLILSALLTLCLILSLCACASQEKITVPKEDPAETTAAPVETTQASEETQLPTEEPTDAPEETTQATEPSSEADSSLAEQLIGAWDWEISLGQLFADQLSQSLGMDLGERAEELELTFCFTLEFAEDGTCKGYFNEEDMDASLDSFVVSFCGVLTDVTYEMLAEQGVGKEEADARFEAEYGCGIEQYYNELMSESVNTETMFAELPTIDSTYKLEGDQLTVAKDGVYNDDAATISIDGDVMTVDGFIDAELEEQFAALGMSLPLTMTRK